MINTTIQIENDMGVIDSVYNAEVIPRVGENIRLTVFNVSMKWKQLFNKRLKVKEVTIEYLMPSGAAIVHVEVE